MAEEKKTTKAAKAAKAKDASKDVGARGEAEAAAGAKATPEAKRRSPAKPKAEPQPGAAAKPKRGARAKKQPAKEPAKPLARKPAAEPKAAAPAKVEAPAEVPAVRASAKYLRSSARKARLVADHIRGKDVETARSVLRFTHRAVARDFERLLSSAVANAENNHELAGDDLRIADLRVDEGPTIKRYRPRAMGRASRIRKRTCHMSITLMPKQVVR